MKALAPRAIELALVSAVFFAVAHPCRGMNRYEDPEDSPLFADSMQKAFAQFVVHDTLSLPTRQEGLAGSEIIVVEGARWHSLRAGVGPGAGSSDPRKGPVPLDVTMGVTVCTTCAPTTCGHGVTCSGTLTCDEPTCRTVTCWFYETCMSAFTCAGSRTCSPADCSTNLFGVTVPRPGQIQMSFNSSASLQYTLQYCTDLSSNQWMIATNARGNGGLMTFSHTNNATLSFYRLLISQ